MRREEARILKTVSIALTGLFWGLMGHLCHFAAPARAADHYNLEEGIPTQLEDSLPTAYRNREIQGLFRWEHTKEGKDIFLLEPRLEYGIFRNAEIGLDVPFELGSGVEGDEGIGDVALSALYNFNQETLWIPAVALTGGVHFPTSDESDGLDTTLKLILSKSIGWSHTWQRLHINAAWKHNDDAHGDEREDYFVGIIGYDRLLGPDTILILDFVREEQKKEDKDSNFAEAGIRYQLTPLTLLAAGVSAGIGDDSPDFRTSLGFQHSF